MVLLYLLFVLEGEGKTNNGKIKTEEPICRGGRLKVDADITKKYVAADTERFFCW